MLHIRRIKMDDNPARGDVNWVLFEQGQLATPLRIISDFELNVLLDEIKEQRAAHDETFEGVEVRIERREQTR